MPGGSVTLGGTARPRLVALRHGRTVWNASGRFQGQADPPLDLLGLEQAESAAAELHSTGWVPAAVVSSDLRRARHTAECVARRFGLEVVLDPALREQALGRWQGLTRDDVRARFPDEFQAWWRDPGVRRGGGESAGELGVRVAGALANAVELGAPGSSVIVVSHGLALQAGLGRLAAAGTIRHDHRAGPAPHLANGEWLPIEWVDDAAAATDHPARSQRSVAR